MSAAVLTAGAAAPGPALHRGMITVSIIQAPDGTIANVALPHMQGSLSASQDQIIWVLTSFIVASAITMPLTGWLCDRFGQKTIFFASIGGFTAALVPLSQAVLLDIDPRERHGRAMAVWGMGVMIGPSLGPTLGGWLTDVYNWRLGVLHRRTGRRDRAVRGVEVQPESPRSSLQMPAAAPATAARCAWIGPR